KYGRTRWVGVQPAVRSLRMRSAQLDALGLVEQNLPQLSPTAARRSGLLVKAAYSLFCHSSSSSALGLARFITCGSQLNMFASTSSNSVPAGPRRSIRLRQPTNARAGSLRAACLSSESASFTCVVVTDIA